MKRKIALAIVLVGAATWHIVPRATFDRDPWLRDFEALAAHTAAVYANLEWMREKRGIDLAAHYAATRVALADARTDSAARAAIAGFVEGFRDPHFRIPREKLSKRIERWVREASSAPPAVLTTATSTTAPIGIPRTASGAEACARMGFYDGGFSNRLSIAGSVVLPPKDDVARMFPVVLVDQAIGVVRIASFSTERFLPACLEAWSARQTALARAGLEACDRSCERKILFVDAPNAILAALARRIAQMKDAGVTTIVVDIAGNGGGTDWVDAAARMFTDRTLPCPRMGYIRHEHWRKRFERMREELAPGLAEQASPLAKDLSARIDRLVADASADCDRRSLWAGVDPGCTLLGREPYYACGLVDSLAADAITDAALRSGVWHTARYTFEPGAWSGQLFVVVDARTSSAAEHFAAVLQDGGAAMVLGQETDGSGCGYTGGGLPITLPHSGIRVEMPDCVRFRLDGTNEIEGVAPDVEVTNDDIERDLSSLLARVTG